MDEFLLGKQVSRRWDVVEEFFLIPNPKLGNYILNVGPWFFSTEEEGLEKVRQLVEQKIYFEVEGGGPDPNWVSGGLAKKIREIAGKYFVFVCCTGELGSTIYWPRDYLLHEDGSLSNDPEADHDFTYDRMVIPGRALLNASDLVDAKGRFLKLVREVVDERRSIWGDAPLATIESSTLQKYIYEGGFDYGNVEIFPGEPLLVMSATRGASRGYQRKWSAHVVLEEYAGWREDELRRRRWKVSLALAYLFGANSAYAEGHLFYDADKVLSKLPRDAVLQEQFYGKKYESYRKTQEEFWSFVKSAPRPSADPVTRIGLLHGHLDGWCGMWETRVWGQFHSPEWEYGPAEKGWNHFYDFFTKARWSTSTVYGDVDYTGNPPMGQVDIVPVESPLEVLQRYSCLMFLGWNTMTEEQYAKLKQYVEGGGHLLAALPHLRTNIKRDEDFTLLNGGDFADLFGVRVTGRAGQDTVGVRFIAESSIPSFRFPVWTQREFVDPEAKNGPIPLSNVEVVDATTLAAASLGADAMKKFPVLTEKRFGKGVAFLLTPWCYPGEYAMDELMRLLIQTVIAGEQGDVRFVGSDKIRFAFYKMNGGYRGFFANTDLDTEHHGTIYTKDGAIPVGLAPCEIRKIDIDAK